MCHVTVESTDVPEIFPWVVLPNLKNEFQKVLWDFFFFYPKAIISGALEINSSVYRFSEIFLEKTLTLASYYSSFLVKKNRKKSVVSIGSYGLFCFVFFPFSSSIIDSWLSFIPEFLTLERGRIVYWVRKLGSYTLFFHLSFLNTSSCLLFLHTSVFAFHTVTIGLHSINTCRTLIFVFKCSKI